MDEAYVGFQNNAFTSMDYAVHSGWYIMPIAHFSVWWLILTLSYLSDKALKEKKSNLIIHIMYRRKNSWWSIAINSELNTPLWISIYFNLMCLGLSVFHFLPNIYLKVISFIFSQNNNFWRMVMFILKVCFSEFHSLS